ncbi:MAG TPA: PIN domain-containing protein [Pyrinomonadaceae bacterium]|nr:PIN domain-containing protein [Pyrinomonadaceae bacterium]
MPNETLFLDTAYVYVLFNTRDQWHEKALFWQKKIAAEKIPLLTTEFILVEIGNGLSSLKFRKSAAAVIHALTENPFVTVVPATSELFGQALALYEERPDKNWGLTDCASFVVMTENDLTEALTTDEHFRQAGFKALLLT